MAHADILDQPERLTGSFWSSVVMHIVIGTALVLYGVAANRPHEQWGSKEGGGFGSVSVNSVATIPLPRQMGPTNPVANPTKSEVPTPPPKAKTEPKAAAKAKAPDPDAIALKSKSKKTLPERKTQEDSALNRSRNTQPDAAPTNKWREQQKDLPNQLYGKAGQALSSPMFDKAGSGALGIGNSTPFGAQLGWYANQLQDRVTQHWRTDDVPPQIRTAPQVVVVFTLRRDGSLAGVPQIKQSSGIVQLDRSAQRAIVESANFPPIPPQFPRNEAEIEFVFELRR
jgi:TonB family protein